MNSIIDKGERLLPAMFSGGMHRIRLATSNGELWGYTGTISEASARHKVESADVMDNIIKEAC